MSARAARARKGRASAPQAPHPAAPGRLSAFLTTRPAYVLYSVAILIPCFWQARIQAGDFSSHLYNAWLAGLIQQGNAPGLALMPQTTNVLLDLILSGLLPAVGLQAAQRIPAAVAVLLLVWGAAMFVRAVSGRMALHTFPVIAMLAYGWTFRMGLLNFYIALGLCFWALAVGWEWKPRRLLAAAGLLAIAFTAHGLPVAWAAAVLVYRHAALRLGPDGRRRLLRVAFAALVAGALVLRFALPTRWFGDQLPSALAFDQVVVYAPKYWIAALGLLAYWSWLWMSMARREGLSQTLSKAPAQVCLLTAAGIVLLPNWIFLPGYNHALVFLAQRMSLALGLCICAATAGAAPKFPAKATLAAACVLFFGFLYTDEAALNALEARMQAAVAQLPQGQRVVNGIDSAGTRTNPLTHMLDRVCIGRCFSYGNYEPPSGQFRVRVLAPNPIVLPSAIESNAIETGRYVVKQRDLPLYQVTLDAAGDVVVRPLQAGQQTGIVLWNGL